MAGLVLLLFVMPDVGQVVTGLVFFVRMEELVVWITLARTLELSVNHDVRIGSAGAAVAKPRKMTKLLFILGNVSREPLAWMKLAQFLAEVGFPFLVAHHQ